MAQVSTVNIGLVLVTGATGFVGSELIRQLLLNGCKVRGTVRSLKSDKNQFLYTLEGAVGNLELVEAELDKEDGWDAAVKGCEIVHHVASPVPSGEVKDENDLIVPAKMGVKYVLEACIRVGGVKKIVMTSSVLLFYYDYFNLITTKVAAIGEGQADKSKKGHIFTSDDWSDISKVSGGLGAYVKSKTIAEKFAWEFISQNSNLSFCTVNPVMILGPCLASHHKSSVLTVMKLLNREVPAVPNMHFNIVDVRDVAAVHILAMTSDAANGKRLIVSAGDMWFPQLAKVLKEEFNPLGYNVPSYTLPSFLIKIVGWFDIHAKLAATMVDNEIKYDGNPVTLLFDFKYITMNDSIVSCGHSLIKHNQVKSTRQYNEKIKLK